MCTPVYTYIYMYKISWENLQIEERIERGGRGEEIKRGKEKETLAGERGRGHRITDVHYRNNQL